MSADGVQNPFRSRGQRGGPVLPRYTPHQFVTRFLGRDVERHPVSRAVLAAAAEIVERVRTEGDTALRELTERYDGARLDTIGLGPETLEAAWDLLDRPARGALSAAADQIEAFHRRSLPRGWLEPAAQGGWWGQVFRPLQRVGVYVPGGRHPYPSTALMAGIPARVAGVPEIIVATPPRPDGTVDPHILAAAHLIGARRVIRAGGAQAVAAMAFGTRAVPRCDKIVGPGNPYVTAAKQLIFGYASVEGLMGPTELLVVADATADPAWVAADLLAQAEHGPDSPAWLFTDDARLLEAVREEAARQAAASQAREVLVQALAARGAAVVVTDLPEALVLANRVAPEHLHLYVADPWALLPQVEHAGTVYLGPWAPAALGDYAAGPSHVLPTGGTARFFSGLGVLDFQRAGAVYAGSPEAFGRLAGPARLLARQEGLTGHAASLEIRARALGLAPEEEEEGR